MAPLKYNDNGPFSMDKDCVVFPAHAASAADLAARSDTHEVVVFVATHGNEHCGVRAVEQLYGEGYFSKNIPENTRVTILVANPKAFAQGQRFVTGGKNLNRVFQPSLLQRYQENLGPSPDACYEEERAFVMCRLIQQADVFIDIHSMSSEGPSMAMPAGNIESETLAASLSVDLSVTKLAHMTLAGGTTLDAARTLNPKCAAVGVECGQHDTASSLACALGLVRSAVQSRAAAAAPGGSSSVNGKGPRVIRCTGRTVVRDGFQWRLPSPVQGFQELAPGQVLADDCQGEVAYTGEEPGILLMPTSIPVVGEEAFFTGVQE